MTQLSKEIFDNYQMRNKKPQKAKFIHLLQSRLPNVTVEENGWLHSKNVVVGDVQKAKVIFAAHYDTCAELPFPNLLLPKNMLVTILFSLAICIPIFILASLASYLMMKLTNNIVFAFVGSYSVLIPFFVIMFAGKPNKHTANDNTSGVITLLKIMDALTDAEKEKVAFVFFDNEEIGLIGSSQFNKRHKQEMKEKLLVNLDCVSDGDHIMVILNKKAQKAYGSQVKAAFAPIDGKNTLIEKSSTTMYPSDQVHFPINIAIAAFKKNRFGWLYLNRIHTKKDTMFDEANIAYISASLAALAKTL